MSIRSIPPQRTTAPTTATTQAAPAQPAPAPAAPPPPSTASEPPAGATAPLATELSSAEAAARHTFDVTARALLNRMQPPGGERMSLDGPRSVPSSPAPAAGVFVPSAQGAPPPLPAHGAPPSSDKAAYEAYQLVKDGSLNAAEAKRVVELAKEDAGLPPGEKDPAKIRAALNNLYVRAGLSQEDARAAAASTEQVASSGNGEVNVKFTPAKTTLPTTAQLTSAAEKNAKSNEAAANTKWSTAQVKADPKGFVRNLTQIDGNTGTSSDHMACVTTSMLGGAILSKPESVQDLAKKLQTPAGQKEFPKMQQEPFKSAVANVASGNFSPRDVSTMGRGLHESMQYTGDDGKMTEGMPSAREMAMLGKLKKIGWNPPPMERTSYGSKDPNANHSTSFANGTGYDPWPYDGNGGQSVVTKGKAAAHQHAQTIGHRLNISKPYQLQTKNTFDGNGNIVRERHVDVNGNKLVPPVKATYTFDEKQNAWVRKEPAKMDPSLAQDFPAQIPVDQKSRKDTMGPLEVDD